MKVRHSTLALTLFIMFTPSAFSQSHYVFEYNGANSFRAGNTIAQVFADLQLDTVFSAFPVANGSMMGIGATAQILPAVLASTSGTNATLTATQPMTDRSELHMLTGLGITDPYANTSGGQGRVVTQGRDEWTILDQRPANTNPTPLNGVNVQLLFMSDCVFVAAGEIRRNNAVQLQYIADINGTTIFTNDPDTGQGDAFFLPPNTEFEWTFPANVGDTIQLGAFDGADLPLNQDLTFLSSDGFFNATSPGQAAMACGTLKMIRLDMLDSLPPSGN